jgi:hypothetical protein
MSKIYGEDHRLLQEQFGTTNIATRLEDMIIKTELDDSDVAFIESRDMFFLSTVDHQSRPTVSYKGGDVGFIRVVNEKTLAFPSYDGNGMFFSMGNLARNPNVGILFIDFEVPHRMRLQGSASVTPDDPLLDDYKEADLIVRINIQQTWVNCPRYIHRYKRLGTSKYVPTVDAETPHAVWKRIDAVQDALPVKDQDKATLSGGVLTFEEYVELQRKGEA